MVGVGKSRRRKARANANKRLRRWQATLRKRRRDRERRRRRRDDAVTAKAGRRGHQECGRKARYATLRMAQQIADRRMALGAPQLWVYLCPHCNGWHLTSHPKAGTSWSLGEGMGNG